MKEKFFLKW